MDQSSRSEGYLGQPDNLQRLKLHSYRFVTTLRAPIGVYEKLCVWLYLLRRVAWLRHRALRKVLRLLDRPALTVGPVHPSNISRTRAASEWAPRIVPPSPGCAPSAP